MTRRAAKLCALVLAVALAVGAGTLLRRHLDGPDPVDTVMAATRAYANGDCAGLRAVTEVASTVDCAEVRQVRDAYRREGLEPDAFSYSLVSRDGAVATVRITYDSEGLSQEELVRLERRGGEWKISRDPAGPS